MTTTERKHLDLLTKNVGAFLYLLDQRMKEPSTVERGRKIANLCNSLELANDEAMRFGLGLSFKQMNNRKGKPAETKR